MSGRAALHHDRRRAESFGAAATQYDRTRPTYPAALVERILRPGPNVLDVGCGTGIAADLMAARGARVLGVEVDGRMAAVAREKGLTVEVAAFEQWDPAGRVFDVVTAGQSWHWVDPATGPYKAAAVLRPGGRLSAFWNVGHPPEALLDAFAAAYAREAPGTDRHMALLGRQRYEAQADGMRGCRLLNDPETETFTWYRAYTREAWLDQLPTHSDHAVLPPGRLRAVLAAIGEVIDRAGGSFTMRFDSFLLSAERL